MPIISSPHKVTETTVSRWTNGRVNIRQGNAIMSFSQSEVAQLRDTLNREVTHNDCANKSELAPIHPGHYLQQEMEHFKLSAGELSALSGCTLWEIQGVLDGTAEITVLMAEKLSRVFARFPDALIDGALGWLHLQNNYDLTILLSRNAEALNV